MKTNLIPRLQATACKLFFSLMFFFTLQDLSAQNTATTIWTETFGLQDTVLKIPTAIDRGDNILVAGSTIDSVTGPDIVLNKYTRGGLPIWSVSYTTAGFHRDQATAIAIDTNSNIILGGFTYTNSTNSYDFLVLKYDSTGTLLWTYTYNGTGSAADIVSAITTKGSEIYITGASTGSLTLFDYTTIKLNSNGTLAWNNSYHYLGNDLPFDIDVSGSNVLVNGGSQISLTDWDYAQLTYSTSGTPTDTLRTTGTGVGFDHATHAVTDVQGYVYITGAYASGSNGMDYKTIKLDQQGNVKWISTFDGASHQDDISNSVGVDFYGNVYVSGQTMNSSGNEDYCTIKYDSTGTQQWVRYYNYTLDDKANRLIIGDDNNIYITGESSNGSNKDFATLAYNTDGDTLWQIRFNGAYNSDDIATNIQKDGDFVYVSGQTKISATTWQYVTIAYGEATFEDIPDAFNEEPGSTWYYPNTGQLPNDTGGVEEYIDFYSHNQSPAMYFDRSNVSYVFSKIDSDTTTADTLHRVDMNFMHDGILPPEDEIYPLKKESSHYLNFYLPHCASGVVDVHGHKRLFVNELYRGIDLYFTSNKAGAKHYFVIDKGDYTDIVMRLSGADSITHSPGTYSIHTSIGTLTYDTLVAYEVDASGAVIPNTMQPLDIYADTANGHWHFVPFIYNTSNTLVIMAKQKVVDNERHIGQPEWSTYFGGDGYDEGTGVTHDTEGNSYFAGFTSSSTITFPTFNGFQIVQGGLMDAYIAKFGSNYNSSQGIVDHGYERLWATYYGGAGTDKALAVSTTGNGTTGKVFITGVTDGNNFPTSSLSGAYNQASNSGSTDAFIVRLDAGNGNNPWATYFGGTEDEIAYSIKNDNSGNFYIAGSSGTTSYSTDLNQVPTDGGFPQFNTLTSWNNGGFQGGTSDGFLAKFTNNGVCLWSSYFGGNNVDEARALAINDNEDVFISGTTASSSDFPLLSFSGSSTDYYQSIIGGGSDAFIAAFDDGGTQLYTTYFGGDGDEEALTITCDGIGNTYIAGHVTSSTPACSTCTCMVPPTGQFPLCKGNANAHLQSNYGGGGNDGFFAEINSDYNIVWSTFYGGNHDDMITSIDNDYLDRLFFTGISSSNGNGTVEPNIFGGYAFTPWGWQYPVAITFYDDIIGYFDENNERAYSTFFGTPFMEVSNSLSVYSTDPNNIYWFITGYTNMLPDIMAPNGSDQCCENAYMQNEPTPSSTHAHLACFSINDMYMMSVENIEGEELSDCLVYPNPTSYNITAKISLVEKENVSIEVYNINGVLLYKEVCGMQQGTIKKQIDFSDYAQGLYLLTIKTDSRTVTKKIAKND